jgi:orotate phosphoribosyltransferase
MTPIATLTAAFKNAGIHVSHTRSQRPFSLIKYVGQLLRVTIHSPGQRLEVTCTPKEFQTLADWLAAVYVARKACSDCPDPPVPVTDHWTYYGSSDCRYLWTLAALDAYNAKYGSARLQDCDPRKLPSGFRQQALELLKPHVKRGTFKLTSGRTSDFLIDCKPAVLSCQGHHVFGNLVNAVLNSHVDDAVAAFAGVELGGCPLASAACLMSLATRHALYIRKAPKDHGTQVLVEGMENLGTNRKVVLLEDVVTTGGSTLRALSTLVAAGLEPVAVIVLVDRLEGGAEAIQAAWPHVQYLPIFTRNDVLAP